MVYCMVLCRSEDRKENLLGISTNIAARIIKGVELLRKALHTSKYPECRAGCNFHIQCAAHVTNLAVKESVRLTQKKNGKVQKSQGCIRYLIKSRDLFKEKTVETGMRC